MSLRKYFLRYWNLWPPLLFIGIKIIEISKDYCHLTAKIEIKDLKGDVVAEVDKFISIKKK